MNKRVFFTIMLIVLSILFSACIYKEEEQSFTSNEDSSIIYMTESLPQGFSSTLEGEEKYTYIYKGLFEGLVGKDQKGNIIPVLAEACDISDDGLQYTFTLRKDICYNTGERITSDTFLNFFEELLHSSQEDKLAEGLKMVYGVLDYHKENTSFQGVAIKAPDDDTLIFRMNYKDEGFLEALAGAEYYLRPIDKVTSLIENYKSISYTGAFYVSKLDDDTLRLSRSPYYHQKQSRDNSDIIITQVQGGEEALTAFNMGLCDIFQNPPLNQLPYLENQGAAVKTYSGSSYGIQFNMETTDIPFRRAIEKILTSSQAFYSLEGLEFSMFSHGNSFYPDKAYEGDSIFASGTQENTVNKSYAKRQVLIGEGYFKASLMEDKDKLYILSLDTERTRRIGGYIERSLEELLGVKVAISYVSSDRLSSESRREDYSMVLYPVKAIKEEAYYLSFGNKDNPVLLKDEKYNRLVEEYNKGSNQDRSIIINSLKSYVEENVIFLPLFYDFNVLCKSSEIQELVFDEEGSLMLKELYKDIEKEDNQDIKTPVG
ncbi:ABC transporter substrate-binding protein [Alloiococcus sp. CFN-8]|uniref:ABC transporter substrate-binding protein n=1 Tax=Alloiococcus sp. CFN-8 TaxID=3416081 RepID=UPI003CEF2E9B